MNTNFPSRRLSKILFWLYLFEIGLILLRGHRPVLVISQERERKGEREEIEREIESKSKGIREIAAMGYKRLG